MARIVLLLPELRGFAPSRDTRDFVARRNIDRRLKGCYEILAMKFSGVLLQPASSLTDEWIAISQAQKHGTGFPQEHDTRRREIDVAQQS